MTRRKTKQRPISSQTTNELLSKPWTKITATIFGVATLIGIGYGAGIFKQDLNCSLEKLQMQQDFNDKISSISNSCLNEKLEKYERTVNTVMETVEQLKNSKDEK